MTYIVMAYRVMAYIVTAYAGMAYKVLGIPDRTARRSLLEGGCGSAQPSGSRSCRLPSPT